MKKNIYWIVLIITSVLFSQCTPEKNYIYLQNKGEGEKTSTSETKPVEYKLKPKDVLYIKIIPIDQATTISLNTETSSTIFNSDLGAYLNSYNINDSGYIKIPLVGDISVANMTIDQAQSIIQTQVNTYLKNALVVTKLLNYSITVLGEVNKPGSFKIYNSKINILEALGMAGDLTINGNRKEIKLVRQSDNGKLVIIDLTDKKLLTSEYFYLQPEDIIYVEPNHSKFFGTNPFPFATVLSSITTLILVLNYISK